MCSRIFIFLFLMFSAVIAQEMEIVWQKPCYGNYLDEILLQEDGGFTLRGRNTIDRNFGIGYYTWGSFIVKFDSEGEMQWSKVSQIPNERFAILRSYESDGVFISLDKFHIEHPHPNFDYARLFSIAKYDRNGDYLTRNFYGFDNPGIRGTTPNDGILLSTDGFLFCGLYTERFEWADVGFIGKIDADGNLEWLNQYNRFFCDTKLLSVMDTGDGYLSFGKIEVPEPWDRPGWDIALFDEEGDLTENSHFISDAVYRTVILKDTANARVLVSGRKNLDNREQAWLACAGLRDSLIWEHTYPIPYDINLDEPFPEILSMRLLSDDRVLLLGTSAVLSERIAWLTLAGERGYRIGNLVWECASVPNKNTALALTDDGCCLVLTPPYVTKVRIDCLNADNRERSTPAASYKAVEAYPNPFNASTVLVFRDKLDRFPKLKIYNQSGQIVKDFSCGPQDIDGHSISVDMADLPAGIYFAVLRNGDVEKNVKLVKLD